MSKTCTMLILLAILYLMSPARAEIITVAKDGSCDFTAIQPAIDYSWDGDTVIVKPGTYTENINFDGRAITLTSFDPNDPNTVAATIISATSGSYSVTFDLGEQNDSILCGFTITISGIACAGSSPMIAKSVIRNCSYGVSAYYGASPVISQSIITNNQRGMFFSGGGSPTITNCTISGNIASERFNNLIYGTGMCFSGSSPTIINCTVTGNTVSGPDILPGGKIYGGGMYFSGSNPTIINCTISSNAATGSSTSDYSVFGGGMYFSDSNPTITNCTITGNSISGNGSKCSIYGGGMYFLSSSPTITNCTISGNTVSSNNPFGGGMYFSGGGPTITECIVSGNVAKNGNGGGMYFTSNIPTIVRCMITGNRASYGGGIYGGGLIRNCTIVGNRATSSGGGLSNCSTARNNTIAFNIAPSGNGGGIYGSCQNTYNCFWANAGGNFANGAYGKIGDFLADPCFAANGSWSDPCSTPIDPYDDVWTEGNYHLNSAGGRWTPTGWILDPVSSLCIDTGDPADAVGEEPAPNGSRINIGNYGGTIWASKTPGQGSGPITFPGLVQNLTLNGGHKHLVLTWQAPADNGGSPITKYRIFRGPNTGALTFLNEVSAGQLSFTDAQVTNGTAYFYAVSAVNSFGEGQQASPILATAEWSDMDFNGDGIVDLADLAAFSQAWLWQAPWR